MKLDNYFFLHDFGDYVVECVVLRGPDDQGDYTVEWTNPYTQKKCRSDFWRYDDIIPKGWTLKKVSGGWVLEYSKQPKAKPHLQLVR